MTLQLLKNLNGNNKGELFLFIDKFTKTNEPRISWYPSAGQDFSALLFLDSIFLLPTKKSDPKPPDIFLFSDYSPWEGTRFLDSRCISETFFEIKHIEELPKLDTKLYPEILYLPKGSSATNKCLFLLVEITSGKLGVKSFPVIYAYAGNESFCAEKLIAYNAKVSLFKFLISYWNLDFKCS
jgi:hypothetical protein